MPTPFAALESRVNASVLQHLANAAGTLAGGPVTGIYAQQWNPAEMLGASYGGQVITFGLPQSQVPVEWNGAPLVITEGSGQGSYLVRELHPAGSDWCALVLEAAL